jgi:hypothetical protein
MMGEDDIYEYLSKLWAIQRWRKRSYPVNKIIVENSLDKLKVYLTKLLYDETNIELRWDMFAREIKGMGSAMMSEIL